jgi:hypothetical protein
LTTAFVSLGSNEAIQWERTKTQHLIRYVPKGTYYARFKAGGKLIRKSLRTDVYSVAKLRLPDLIGENRALVEAAAGRSSGKLTFGDIVSTYHLYAESDRAVRQIFG